VPVLVGTAVALVILTVLTVAAKLIDLGPLNLYIAMFIAVIKAALVCLFFMHLKYDRPFNSIVFIASVLFMALFLWLAVLDTATYRNEVIPPTAKEFAPGLTRFKQ
jgi:cytochrome c oxidase subunit 4